jgi:hypothetical protein
LIIKNAVLRKTYHELAVRNSDAITKKIGPNQSPFRAANIGIEAMNTGQNRTGKVMFGPPLGMPMLRQLQFMGGQTAGCGLDIQLNNLYAENHRLG